MKAEKDIQRMVKAIIDRRGLTYRDVSELMDCSFQSVWDKLNNRKSPEVQSIREILRAVGFDFSFYEADREVEMEARRGMILDAVRRTHIRWRMMWELCEALGIDITIAPIRTVSAEGGRESHE